MTNENNGKVLIIEFKDRWQTILKRYIDRFGIKTHVASSKEEAIDKIGNNNYYFATLDLTLHSLSESFEGLALLKKLEEEKLFIPTIIISGNDKNRYTIAACNFSNVVYFCSKDDWGIPQVSNDLDGIVISLINGTHYIQRIVKPVQIQEICRSEQNINLLEYSSVCKKKSYILFVDCEGFSSKDEKQQANVFTSMIDITKNTDVITGAKTGKGFAALLTGDGMAVIFDAEEYCLFPLKLAFQIQAGIHNKVFDFKLRYGIHFGDLYVFENPYALKQFIGPQLNKTARIMDFGFGNHILSSIEYFDQYIKKCGDPDIDGIDNQNLGIVKHKKGEEFTIINYYTRRYGNRSKKLRT